MFEVRVHGRRGQGVLVTAELLAIAASLEGRHAQALPGFGTERVAGEIVAYCRIDDHEITTQEPVLCPDALIVEDQDLLDKSPVLDGLHDDGYLLVNSRQRIENLPLPTLALCPERAITVPATEMARKLTGHPTPSAALLGGFAALSGAMLLDSVLTAARQWFRGPTGKAHAAAAVATFGIVRTEIGDLGRTEVG
jgi:pyruvate ferredoxin oxidoreductase gamma subunit